MSLVYYRLLEEATIFIFMVPKNAANDLSDDFPEENSNLQGCYCVVGWHDQAGGGEPCKLSHVPGLSRQLLQHGYLPHVRTQIPHHQDPSSSIRKGTGWWVLTVVTIKITVFWGVTPYSLVDTCECFGRLCHQHIQDRRLRQNLPLKYWKHVNYLQWRKGDASSKACACVLWKV